MKLNLKNILSVLLICSLVASNVNALSENQKKVLGYAKGLATGVGAASCAYLLASGEISEGISNLSRRLWYDGSIDFDKSKILIGAIPVLGHTVYDLTKDTINSFRFKKEEQEQKECKTPAKRALSAVIGLSYSALTAGALYYMSLIALEESIKNYLASPSNMEFFEELIQAPDKLAFTIAPIALAYSACKSGSKAYQSLKLAVAKK